MARWNNSSMLSAHLPTQPDRHLFTDASGSWGCGALCNHDWFHHPWPVEWAQTNIATRELVPNVLAVGLWGRVWQGLHILVRSDNMAVVELFRSRSSHDPDLMHLLRCLHFLAARYDISLAALHIRGVDNTAAFGCSPSSMLVPSDDATSKPMQFWNEIHCACARDNVYQAPVLLVGGPGNEARSALCRLLLDIEPGASDCKEKPGASGCEEKPGASGSSEKPGASGNIEKPGASG